MFSFLKKRTRKTRIFCAFLIKEKREKNKFFSVTLFAKRVNKTNITPSTVFDFIYGKSKYPNLLTIKRLCIGAKIKIKDFFDRDYFDDDEIY